MPELTDILTGPIGWATKSLWRTSKWLWYGEFWWIEDKELRKMCSSLSHFRCFRCGNRHEWGRCGPTY